MTEQNIENEMYLFKAGISFAIICVAWYFRHMFRSDRKYAWFIKRDYTNTDNLLRKEKAELLKYLHEHIERIKKNVKILDVGSGPGIYIPFLQENTKLVCLDPNPHLRGYIEQKYKKCDNVDFVQGCAEDMPFESESFDAAICVLVLCVVHDISKSLKEIKRVLKPGGKLYILHHESPSDNRMWTYVLHCAWVPLVRLIFGCRLTRDTVKSIKNAGFSDVYLHYVYPKAVPLPLKTCVIGVATN